MSARPKDHAPRLFRSAIVCVVFAVAALAGAGALFKWASYAAFVQVSEPSGWRSWPALADGGGYSILYDETTCVGHGLQCAWEDVALIDEHSHVPRGISLNAIYAPVGIYATTPVVRAQGSIRVVSVRSMYGDDTYGLAFDTSLPSRRVEFRRAGEGTIAYALLLEFVLLFVALLVAVRTWSSARHFANPARWRPGMREASGTITFHDGTPPIQDGDRTPQTTRPGPVLVRLRASDEGAYRKSPRSRAEEVLEGDPLSLTAGRRSLAIRIIRVGLVTALLVFGFCAFGAAAAACGRMGWMV